MRNKTNKFSVTSILVISTLILNPYIMAQSKVTLKKQTENTERNIYYRTINAAGHNIFYRESGPQDAPVILLLHGYPTSSHIDRKSTRLNSSHVRISYAVFCLKKKKT